MSKTMEKLLCAVMLIEAFTAYICLSVFSLCCVASLTPNDVTTGHNNLHCLFCTARKKCRSCATCDHLLFSCGCFKQPSPCQHGWSSQRKILGRFGCTPDHLSVWRHCRHRHHRTARVRVTEAIQWSSVVLATWPPHR